MRKLFEEYGRVVVIIIAVVALITMVTVLTNEGGALNSAFKVIVQQFSDKTSNMIEGSAGGAGGSSDTDTSSTTAGWAALVEASEDGSYVTKYPVGTEVALELQDGTTAVFVVVAHNQDTLADGSGTANMTLISKGVLATYQMNKTITNSGGWGASGLRSYLQTNPYIPTEVIGSIKAVTKTSNKFDGGSIQPQITVDKLWVPSHTEVGGTDSTLNGTERGSAYSCFADKASRIKHNTSDSAAVWWLRSASYSNSTHFCFVTSTGAVARTGAHYSYGVVLGFCI